MHPEEPLGALQVRGQPPDRQGRGVARDHRIGTGDGLDRRQHRCLDRRRLEHGLLHEVGVRDGLGQGPGRPHVGLHEVGPPHLEEALLLEVAGLPTDPDQLAPGGVGVRVGDRHPEPGDGQDLGDPAAHVTGADDGDVSDAHPLLP